MRIFKERIILATVISLILIVLIAIFRPQPDDPEYNSKTQWNKFWVNKTHFTYGKYDVVALGDSRTYRGLVPQEIESQLQGLKVLNFGYSAGGLNEEIYKEGEKRLVKNNKPKIILLSVTPRNLSEVTRKNDFFFQEKHRKFDYIFAHMYASGVLDKLQPFSFEILKNIAGFSKPAVMYYQEFHTNGWAAAWTIPERPELQLADYRVQFENPDNRLSPRLLEEMIQQIENWTSKGYFVFVYRPPTTVKMRELEDKYGGIDENELITKVENANGIWLDFPCSLYHSYDGSHLHKESAYKFSRDLGSKISTYLNSNYNK